MTHLLQTVKNIATEVKTEVANLAGGMQSLGLKKGYCDNLYAYDSKLLLPCLLVHE
jgi:hypothetical protein